MAKSKKRKEKRTTQANSTQDLSNQRNYPDGAMKQGSNLPK